MVILIAGGTHTGKTVLAQKLLEQYRYPYLSIDHLKMGLIRSGHCSLTPESSEAELTYCLWPVVREMVKTAVENGQNLIVEGTYIPFDYQVDFTAEYLREIRYICLIFSERYIRSHYADILRHASDIERRTTSAPVSMDTLLRENQTNLRLCKKHGLAYALAENTYAIPRDIIPQHTIQIQEKPMNNKTVKIYFSPTGNTKKSVDAMAAAIGGDIVDCDVTVDQAGEALVCGAEDFAVFGMPVYGGRIPKAARDRLLRFRGTQTPCVVLVTYGNRHYDDALLELADLAQAQGFVVRGAAALVGRHTYGDIQAHRPDKDDLAADAVFARRAAENGDLTRLRIAGNRPYKDGGGGGSFRPLTSDACTACGLCVRSCPTGAIGADCKTIDNGLCISCFRCIRICPAGAKHMNTENYLAFAQSFSERLKDRRENEYFL